MEIIESLITFLKGALCFTILFITYECVFAMGAVFQDTFKRGFGILIGLAVGLTFMAVAVLTGKWTYQLASNWFNLDPSVPIIVVVIGAMILGLFTKTPPIIFMLAAKKLLPKSSTE